MIIIDEINGEIAKLEAQTQTYQTIERLAALYIVRDHNTIPTSKVTPAEPSMVTTESGTQFMTACSGHPMCDGLAVMDELMSTLQVLMPRLYDGVIQRLQ